MGLFTKLFGTRSEREIKKFSKQVDAVLALEDTYKALTDDQVGLNRDDLKITITRDQDAGMLTVSDNGIGMTAETIYLDAGCSAPDAKRLHDEYIPYSAETMRERTELYPGVAEGLCALHAKGITLAVLSLKSSDQIWRPLERAGVDKYIDSVISPDEVAAHKPEPDGIFYLSEKTGIALSDILYVGDSVTDMKTAINAGVDFAAVCTGAITAEAFADMGAKMIYPTFADMCRVLTNNDL